MRYPKFTRLAKSDLLEIAEYIALDNPDAAHRVMEAIEETACALVSQPDMGRSVESNLYDDLKSLPCGDFPIYQVFYLTLNDELVVVRVLHGARDIPRILND